MWDAEGKFHPNEDPKKPLLSQNGSNFRGVTTEGRRCNDVLFAILFVLMFIGMGVVNAVGFMKGDPSKLLPSDQYDLHNVTGTAEFWFQDSVAHLKRDFDILSATLGIAFLLGLFWVQLMRVFTKIFIYITIFFGILLVILAGVYSFSLGAHKDENSLKITSYCLFGLAFILVLVVIFLRKKITLTAALFTECCRGVQHNPGLFIIVALVFTCLNAFMAYWFAGFVFLFSITDDSVSVHLPNQMPAFNTSIRNLMYFNVFGFLWTVAFLSGIFQISVAGAISSWYFSRSDYAMQEGSPSFRSFGYAVSKSFGSVAFGSLILAVVEFLNFLVTKLKKVPTTNKVMQYLACLLKCFLSCIEGLVKLVNRFAYISIAMHGDSFCSSARNAYELISRNSFSAVIVDTLSDFVLFVGKLLGTCACGIFALFMLHILDREVSLVTMISVVVISFVVFSLFANIVGVGVDTVMLCYLEDLERNKGKNMSIDPSLHDLLQEKHRQAALINS